MPRRIAALAFTILPLAFAGSAATHGLTIFELPQVLEVTSPRILPTSILYPWKELGRSIERLTTRGSLAKAELELRFADEKLVELAFVIDEKSDNERAMARALENYQHGVERLALRIAAVGGDDGLVTRRVIAHLLEHAKIISSVGLVISEEIGKASEVAIAASLAAAAKADGETFKNEIDIRRESVGIEIQEGLAAIEALRAIHADLDSALDEIGFPGNPGVPPAGNTPCTKEYRPVCGANSVSYDNRCFAEAAGTSVKYDGRCHALPPPLPAPPTENPPPGTPAPKLNCVVAGCSSELCVSTDEGLVVSPCIYNPGFACYKNATCEAQPDGTCGWTETPELKLCLASAGEPPAPPPPSAPAVYEFTIEADDSGFYPSPTIEAPKGAVVKITFNIRTTNIYYAGLDIRSEKFQTPPIAPGGNARVEFLADRSFEFRSFWPFSTVAKATGNVVVPE